MKMYLAGEWVDRESKTEVKSPYDGRVIDVVPAATAEDADLAAGSAARGADVMRKSTGYERFLILRKAAEAIAARQDELGRTISREEGKTLAEGRQ